MEALFDVFKSVLEIIINLNRIFMKNKIKEKAKNIFSFQDTFLRKDNIIRDIVVIVFAVVLAALLILNHRHQLYLQKSAREQEIANQAREFSEEKMRQSGEMEENESEPEIPQEDTANWQSYKSDWYGFELKYPENWKEPALVKKTGGAKWDYRFEFRKKETYEGDPYSGFDVIVYDVKNTKELFDTDEFPAFKSDEFKADESCAEITGHLTENEDYPAEEIYVSPDDNCRNPAFFYSLTRDEYIYNIIPIQKDGREAPVDSKKETVKNFPEFFSVASSFDLVDIKRPKPQPATPKITAPMPVAAIRVNGRLVCAKKNDHPFKSKKNKKKHLDMECCLDPDEYPNPHCYYPKDKYGKYL